MLSGSREAAFPRPFFGIFLPMCCQRLRNVGISLLGMLSATGTRGSFTMPLSMASMSEKSLTVQGKRRSFRVAGPAQKERSRGQIDHAPDTELAPHCLQARDPHSCSFLVLLRLGAVVALQGAFLVLLGRLLAVAVVGLVVKHQDVLHAHEVRHHPLEHLARGLAGRDVRTPALEEGAASLRDGEGLALHEGVVVGDDDLRAVEVAEHVGRHQLAALVVAVRVVRLEHPQAVRGW